MEPDSAHIQRVSRVFSRRSQIRLVVGGAVVGILVGLIVAAYRKTLSVAEWTLRTILVPLGETPWGVALWVCVLLALAAVVHLLCTRVPQSAGSGIPQIEAKIMGVTEIPWYKVGPAKFLGGALCAFAGLSLGREGPSVQLGGLCGQAVGTRLTPSDGERRLLVTCGAGAGMAAAFQAPLTGVMFTIEEIHRAFSAPLVIATMSSCVASVMVVTGLFGGVHVLPMDFSAELSHGSYWIVALLGVVCGVAGWAFTKGMERGQDLFRWLKDKLPFDPVVVPFLLAAPVAFLAPVLLCGGDGLIDFLEGEGSPTLLVLGGLLLGKYLFTNLSAGSGAPGGTLYPLVVMGLLLGAVMATVFIQSGMVESRFFWNFTLLGVAGLFASVIQAPVTGCVLVFELTGSFSALLSLALVALLSYLVCALLGGEGYYERLLAALLESDSLESGHRTGVGGLRMVVGCGSIMDGLTISQVTWPEGCAPVSVERAGRRHSAQGSWRLRCGDEVMVWADRDDLGQAETALEYLSMTTPEDCQCFRAPRDGEDDGPGDPPRT